MVFSHICSLAHITVMLPHIVVVGAVKCVRNAMLLKLLEDRIMGNSTDIEGRKEAERRARERVQGGRVERC